MLQNFNEAAKKMTTALDALDKYSLTASQTKFEVDEDCEETTKKDVLSGLHTSLKQSWIQCKEKVALELAANHTPSAEKLQTILDDFKKNAITELVASQRKLDIHCRYSLFVFKIVVEAVAAVLTAGLLEIPFAIYRKKNTGSFWPTLSPNSTVMAENMVLHMSNEADTIFSTIEASTLQDQSTPTPTK